MKIINLKTGKVRTHESPPSPKCEVCGVEVKKKFGGIIGNIGSLPAAFCGVCISGIIGMLVEQSEEKKK